MKLTLKRGKLQHLAGLLLTAGLTLTSSLATTLNAASVQTDDSLRSVTCLAVSPDGKHVVSGGGSLLVVQRWDDLQVVQTFTVPIAQLHDAQFSADGNSLLLAGGTPAEFGNVALLSWPQLRVMWTHQLSDDVLYSATFLTRASPLTQWRGWPEEMERSNLRAAPLSLRPSREHRPRIILTKTLNGSNRIAVAGHDHAVYVLDVEGGESSDAGTNAKDVAKLSSHSKPVTSVCVVGNSRLIASCSVDGTVRIWDEDSGQLARTLSNHLKAVRMIAVRPAVESRLPMLASVSDDRTLRLWQPTIGRMVRFKRLTSPATAVAWNVTADRVIVGTRDGSVVAVNPDDLSLQSLASACDAWVTELACHPTLRGVAVGDSNGNVKKLTLAE